MGTGTIFSSISKHNITGVYIFSTSLVNIDDIRGAKERKPGDRTASYGEGLRDVRQK
ncbi:MAG: hypothetical protein G01um101448_863 [Parcubacteria group bacterium Gr01-1014_48]|nr:MAG: hypothetical protein Greene041614_1018 [Parcubacteria group bacterium Greene0416_14]TSC73225.1 MAG: hypothetical protein G01um101448_863 [Parcubacteria group bacterium Gr01-1014_48]TSD00488.1 MAG: hypothetical protein Greene101415_837 [Parcubacteria group bacterium Greene1014_15]TSD08377.1 MAG: hypothetical protein Greene07144_93 [Parcubacteria group bacterium Greene0714_4]